MGSIANWNTNGGKESLSQRFLGKVKPDTPVKNKIEFAQKKLEFQITKLSQINDKLKKKHMIFFYISISN